MPRCPRCGKEIDSILNVQSGYMEYVLKIDKKNGDYDYQSSNDGFTTDDSLNDFCCPECHLSLFPDSEEDAIAFLRGEVEARYDENEMRVLVVERKEEEGEEQQQQK
jgi:predicted RNA-binding Zn-ribbon protein involved in translation (DUF1610 family)